MWRVTYVYVGLGDSLEANLRTGFKAEEAPMALLLGHAAFLGEKKGTRRRAALWYLSSADRLEKGGVVRLSFIYSRTAPF